MKYINTNKMEKIKINKDNTYFLFDFDKTITSNKSADSWAASGKLLGDEFAIESNEIYLKYRPIELSYQITKEEKEKLMEEWYSKCMDLYYRYHLTEELLKKSIEQSNLIFRKGAQELLQKANEANIPVVILSAGIGNVIEQFLKANNCYYDNIYIISNFIEFEENGEMKKFDNSKIVHTLNKTMKDKISQSYLEKLKNRTYKILLGDIKEDENMVEKEEWDTTLKIGILENKVEENIKIYKEAFDIILTGDDATFDIIDSFFM